MARERKRVLGQLAAFKVAMIASMFGGGRIDPDDINPFAVKPRMSAANRALLERDKKETMRAARRRHVRPGAKRVNVRHFPITPTCSGVERGDDESHKQH